MERNNFKERCDVRLAALNMTQDQLGELVGKPRQRLTEAFRGEKSPAASSLRVAIDQALNRKIEEKRVEMIDALLDVLERDTERSWNPADVSLILPEDLFYIVTERGKPVGTWNPVTKKYQAFEEPIVKIKELSPWISVTERLPEVSGEYLTWHETGYYGVLSFNAELQGWNVLANKDRSTEIRTVTHWMPLPEGATEAREV